MNPIQKRVFRNGWHKACEMYQAGDSLTKIETAAHETFMPSFNAGLRAACLAIAGDLSEAYNVGRTLGFSDSAIDALIEETRNV